ncbi:MAG: hypothetical protein WC321_06270 [Candidatus Omnitrophota bacterium]|jgi:hypothetical protein
MAEKNLKLKTTKMGGKGGGFSSLRHKSGLFYFIACLLIFTLGFQPVALASGRSSAGGGKIAKPDFGKVAQNIGISIGTMVVTSALGAAWEAAKPAAAPVSTAPLQPSTIPPVGTSVPVLEKISLGVGDTFKTMGNFATNNAGVTGGASPLAAFGSSLQNSFNFTSIANTAYLLKGLPTYAATYQVNRAIGMAGAYHGWTSSKTFLLSSFASGATTGFLEPEIALGSSLPKNVTTPIATSMLKGAFVGGLGGYIRGSAILAVDRDRINDGKAPGAGAQIAGLFAGVAGTNLARAVVNPATYQQQVLQKVEVGPKLGEAGPKVETDKSIIQYQEISVNKDYEETLKPSQLGATSGQVKERLMKAADIDAVAPNVYDITLPEPAGTSTTLYRIFVKAPIIDTLSRESWPGLAGDTVGILLSESMAKKENGEYKNKWAPLYASLGSAVSESVFSSVANLGGVGLDLNLGDKHDLTLARLQYSQAVKTTGLNYVMDKRLPEMDSALDNILVKDSPAWKEMQDLNTSLSEDRIDSVQYEDEMRKLQTKWGLLQNKDKPYMFMTDLSEKSIEEKFSQLNAQNLDPRELEKQLEQLKYTATDIFDFNRNFVRLQERMRVENKMSGVSLGESLAAVGLKKSDLILDNMLRGVLSNGFRTFVDSAVGITLVKEDGAIKNRSLLVSLAGLARGIAWDLSWQRTTDTWEWDTPGKKYTLWDYPEPEKYDVPSEDPSFDVVRYLDYKINYPEDYARWERTVSMDPAITVIPHTRQKFDLVQQEMVDDKRLVAHTVIYNEDKPSLKQHITASMRQAATDYLTGTLSFGRPSVRLGVGDPHVGIEPRQVSSAMFLDYVDTLQNLSQMKFADAVDYNARQAAINSVSKSLASSLAQIPLPGKKFSSVGELFSLQPERLVLRGKYIQGDTVPIGRMIWDFKGEKYMLTPLDAGKYILQNTIESPVFQERQQGVPQVPEGIRDSFEPADTWTPPEKISTETMDYWRNRAGDTYWGEINGVPFIFPEPQLQQSLPQVILISNAPQANWDDWSMERGRASIETSRQLGDRTFYYVTNPVSYTIENLGYGGGGLPHAAASFWTPFPNPLYNLVPQTGPTRYLKQANYGTGTNKLPPASTAPEATRQSSPNLYNSWTISQRFNLENNPVININNKKDGSHLF